jgi:HAD superfamily hydrolase (TIGR01509 family)
MIKAIVFDCFGVLASDGWLPYKARHFGSDPDLAAKATALNRKVDAGNYSYDDFVVDVARLAGLSEQQAREQIEDNVPDLELFNFIKELRKEYKIGMLSNAGDNWLEEIFEPEQIAMFDAIALSYELGVTKPHHSAYQTIAERLEVSPEHCVFIDDQPKYVDGAVQAGMKGIVYSNAAQLRTELADMLSRP